MTKRLKKESEINIDNPQKTVFIRWIIIDIVLLILGLNSLLTFDINSFDGMIIMVSITVILTSLFFFKSTYKNMKLIDAAINNKKMIVHWKYTKDEWMNFLNHEEKFRFEMGKSIAVFLSFITIIIFGIFILIIPDNKFTMFLVMLGLFVLYAFMAFIFPSISFYFRRKHVGQVILFSKGILLNKQFHTWDFPLSKFTYAEHKTKPYNHIAVIYDFFDRTGPRDYVVNVPIPKNNKKNISKIISQFK